MSPARVAHGTNPLRDPRDKRLPRIAGPCGAGPVRGHRRPRPQEAHAGDLRPGQPRPAAAGLQPGRVRPAGLGRPGLRQGRLRRRQGSTPARRSARRSGAAGRGLPVRARARSTTTTAFDLLAETVRAWRTSAAPAATTPSTCPSRPAFFSDGVRAARPQRPVQRRTPARGAASSSRSRSATTSRAPASSTTSSSGVFPPDAVFRIDHYLGKETVQNLLALRFANQMFEPVWNANYVDHVQITMAEDIGIGGRAGYYDGIGAARDVIQNHLLQLLALDRDGGAGLLRRPGAARREGEGPLGGPRCPRTSPRPRPAGSTPRAGRVASRSSATCRRTASPTSSTTETYAAIKLEIDTRRWAGVPFYLRTGKRLGKRVTEIAVVFKQAPHLPFNHTATEELGQNAARHPGPAGRGHHHALRLQGARRGHGGPRRDDGLRLRPRPSPSPPPRPTSGSSSTCCSATRRCSRGTRRSSCPGTSSTRSRRSGPSTAAPSPTPPAAGAPGCRRDDGRDGRKWRMP